ncbi:hypothetical protein B0T14DRAFT_146765 [Immersiella caudata]|uniref:Ankyrin n=1 Tax=Immersiella caudata TaxID=314043 RepID=A0AA40C7M3_9PEZI|nr:hypothetical protein B0T14DRAFT_146765 [Immersiella caudata]
MVRILDLPAELFHEILIFACLVRGVRRALRLNLVSTAFQRALQPALFASGLLDAFHGYGVGETLALWQVKHYPQSKVQLWHQYIAHRIGNATVLNEKPYQGPDWERRLLLTRRVGEAYCELSGSTCDVDWAARVRSELAWLVLDRAAGAPGESDWIRLQGEDRWELCRRDTGRLRMETYSLGVDLLSLAAHLNNIHLAKKLLSEGHCPSQHNYLLPPATETAAFAGHREMLLLLQEHLPDYDETSGPRRSGDDGLGYKSDTGALYGAALRGDLEMVKLALYPPSRKNADDPKTSTDIFGYRWGCTRESFQHSPADFIYYAVRATRDWPVFEYLISAFGWLRPNDEYTKFRCLYNQVNRGNMDMLTAMVHADGFGFEEVFQNNLCTLLRCAVRQCREDIVDYIFEHMGRQSSGIARHFASECDCITQIIGGLDPDTGPPLPLLAAAAATGSVSMLKKLIDRGLRVEKGQDSGWHPALVAALEQENLEMASVLLTLRGPSGRWRKKLLKRPEDCGLGGLSSAKAFIQAHWGNEHWQPGGRDKSQA